MQSPHILPGPGNIYYQYKNSNFSSLYLNKKSQSDYKLPTWYIFPQYNFNFCVSVNRRIIN